MQLFRRDNKKNDDEELERFYRNLQTVERPSAQEGEERSSATQPQPPSRPLDPTLHTPPARQNPQADPPPQREPRGQQMPPARSGASQGQRASPSTGMRAPASQRQPLAQPASRLSQEPPEAVERAESGRARQPKGTRIGTGTVFSGKLDSDSNITIEGSFDGELEAQNTIYIAEAAEVQADLAATEIVIAGNVVGTMRAGKRFHALPSARITGEVQSSVLVIEEGAEINCTFSMQDNEEYRLYE